MKRRVAKIRLYPTNEQQQSLAKAFGCSRWWWNFPLNKTIQTYQETGKGLSDKALNALLPALKKEHEWLKQTYSQVYQSTTRNLSRAFLNFFEKRAAFPRFKSRKPRQSIQYPQGVKIEGDYLKVPFIGLIEATFRRLFEGETKTVTISKDSSGKYFASILFEDVAWGMFVNFLSYKLERKGGKLIEIDRWFPSSKLCSKCLYQMSEISLDVRSWTCPNCGTDHDRDENAANNIRVQGIRILWALGTSAPAAGGDVRPKLGRKPKPQAFSRDCRSS